jgi:hypothetical protein
MKEYLIEFDVSLWDYVLYYRGEKYTLKTLDRRRAHELAELRMLAMQKQ